SEMPLSTFMGLETTLRGILAQQLAIDVTGHNISNANTVGYTRQRAMLTPTDPYTVPGTTRPPQAGQLGTGVDVSSYQRVRDSFIDIQYRAQAMRQGAADATQDGLKQVEGALNEPSANDLYDQRDNLIDRLSELGNVTVTDTTLGQIDISIAGASLVTGATAATVAETDLTSLTSGKLSGLIKLRDTTIPGYQAQLDTLASTLITATNTQHALGSD